MRPINDFFVTLDQLLLVPGMTPELFYGYNPEDPDEVKKYEQALERGRNVPLGLRDCLTVVSSGQVNVNTAREEVLTAIFATKSGDNISDGKRMAESVMDAVGARRGRQDNDKAARTINDLATVLGADGGAILAGTQQIHPLGVQSSTFLVTAEGKILDRKKQPRATKHVETMLTRSYQGFVVNEEQTDNRERNFRNDEFKDYMRRHRKKDSEEKIGAFQVPLVYCYWWSEN